MSNNKNITIEDLIEYINKRAIPYEEPAIILSEKQYEYFNKHLKEECDDE